MPPFCRRTAPCAALSRRRAPRRAVSRDGRSRAARRPHSDSPSHAATTTAHSASRRRLRPASGLAGEAGYGGGVPHWRPVAGQLRGVGRAAVPPPPKPRLREPTAPPVRGGRGAACCRAVAGASSRRSAVAPLRLACPGAQESVDRDRRASRARSCASTSSGDRTQPWPGSSATSRDVAGAPACGFPGGASGNSSCSGTSRDVPSGRPATSRDVPESGPGRYRRSSSIALVTAPRITAAWRRASYARCRQLREQYRLGLVPSEAGTGVSMQNSHRRRPSLSVGISRFMPGSLAAC
jgi:hypothetical protein